MTSRETKFTALRRALELRGFTLKRGLHGFTICDDTDFPIVKNLETLDEAQAAADELKAGDSE